MQRSGIREFPARIIPDPAKLHPGFYEDSVVKPLWFVLVFING